MPDIISSVIIPVSNRWEQARACLEALAPTLPPEICEVIVVDASSGDETPAACPALGARLFGGNFQYIRSKKKPVFGPAANLAAKQARGMFLVFMNNYALARPGWHEPLLEDFLNYGDIAASGPVTVYPPVGILGERVRHLGLFVAPDKTVGRLYEGLPAASPLAGKRRFFQALADDCLMIPRELFFRAGGFDEGYYGGFEDVDLCARLGQSGFRLTVNPRSTVVYQADFVPDRAYYESYDALRFAGGARRLLSADLHGFAREDGFALQLSEWLTLSFEMPEAERPEEAVRPVRADPLSLWGRLCERPLRYGGYVKLAGVLSGLGRYEEAQILLADLLRLRPSPENALRLFECFRAAGAGTGGSGLAALLKYCRTFDYYQKYARRMSAEVSALGLDDLAGRYAGWQNRENAFRRDVYTPFLQRVSEITRDLKPSPMQGWAYALWHELEHRPFRLGLPPVEVPAGAEVPFFSVIMPVYNPEIRHLREAIDSVLGQSWPHWELCIADDVSTDPRVREALHEYALRDPRVRVEHRAHNGNISEASNTALAMARYEYAALLDQDDLLASDALAEVARAALGSPGGQLFYSDEDKVGDHGGLQDPYFKSGWDPELLKGQNCIGHLGVYRTEKVRACGGFRSGFEGSQDHDLVLRYAEKLEAREIVHIPLVLYHWRRHAKSTAVSSSAKPEALERGVTAVQEHLDRSGLPGLAAKMDRLNFYAVKYRLPRKPPPVSVIMDLGASARAPDFLEQALFRPGNYPNLECILLYDEGAGEAPVGRGLSGAAAGGRMRLVPLGGNMTYSERVAAALERAGGEVLAFLGRGVAPASPNWLEDMVAHLCASGAAALGGRLLTRRGAAHSLGHAVDAEGRLFSLFRGLPSGLSGWFGWMHLCRTVPSLDPRCLLARREDLERFGGPDPAMGEAGLIDYCLRAGEAGLRSIVAPGINFVLRGEEKVSWETGAFVTCAALTRRWAGRLKPCHPYLSAGDRTWTIRRLW